MKCELKTEIPESQDENSINEIRDQFTFTKVASKMKIERPNAYKFKCVDDCEDVNGLFLFDHSLSGGSYEIFIKLIKVKD